MIGLLNTGAIVEDDGFDDCRFGADDLSDLEASGPGGFGIGLGTTGFGQGRGRLTGSHSGKPPSVRMGASSVKGALPPEVIQRIVRQNFGRFRLCYENALRTDPTLQGSVTVKFVIGTDGTVSNVSGSGTLGDDSAVQCIARSFGGLSFPSPEGGVVNVTYPILFSPGEAAATLGGKALADVTADDVSAALEKAGCTEVTRREKPSTSVGPTVFTAKKDGHEVTITFVAHDETPLGDADLRALDDAGVLVHEGAFVLAIAIDGDPGKTSARSLLDAVVVRR